MVSANCIKAAFKAAALKLEENREALDAMNVFPIPDGDTGTNMSLTLNAAARAVDAMSQNASVCEVLECAAGAALHNARGNSGVIFSILLRGFSKAVCGQDVLSGSDIAQAMEMGVQAAYNAIAEPVEGTMLTVARCAAMGAVAASEKGISPAGVLAAALAEAESALLKTTKLLPALEAAGVVDSGGFGLVLILQAMSATGGALHIKNCGAKKPEAYAKANIAHAYCMDFALHGDADSCVLRTEFARKCDSIVIARDGDIIKLHVHTNEPDSVLQIAGKYGEVKSHRVEDMPRQLNGGLS